MLQKDGKLAYEPGHAALVKHPKTKILTVATIMRRCVNSQKKVTSYLVTDEVTRNMFAVDYFDVRIRIA